MKLDRSEVHQWLEKVAPGIGLVRLAQIAGLPRLRITQQVSRGSVIPATITSIARGLDLDPLTELTQFTAFSDLVPGSPAAAEIPAFIPTPALLQATALRLTSAPVTEEALGGQVPEEVALDWFDLADDGGLRAHLHDMVGVAQPSLWKMLRTRLREDVSLTVAEYAGFNPVSALVVSGVLTGSEAGWEAGCRAEWVNSVSLGVLLEVTEKRLREVGKRERALETFENHLG